MKIVLNPIWYVAWLALSVAALWVARAVDPYVWYFATLGVGALSFGVVATATGTALWLRSRDTIAASGVGLASTLGTAAVLHAAWHFVMLMSLDWRF